MKLTIRLPDGMQYVIKDLPEAEASALFEQFNSGDEPVITFTMDGRTVKIARPHIISIEID